MTRVNPGDGQLLVRQASYLLPQLTRTAQYAAGGHWGERDPRKQCPQELPREMAPPPSERWPTPDSPKKPELHTLLKKHHSDKMNPFHNYTYVYNQIFEDLGRSNPLRVLEIGMGTNNSELISTMGKYGTPGASLRAWKEYLPRASIFGADIDRDILFTEERIRTGFVDQLSTRSFSKLRQEFGGLPFDVLIEPSTSGSRKEMLPVPSSIMTTRDMLDRNTPARDAVAPMSA